MDKGLLVRMFLYPAVDIACGILSNFLPAWTNAASLTAAVLLGLDKVMTWREDREE